MNKDDITDVFKDAPEHELNVITEEKGKKYLRD